MAEPETTVAAAMGKLRKAADKEAQAADLRKEAEGLLAWNAAKEDSLADGKPPARPRRHWREKPRPGPDGRVALVRGESAGSRDEPTAGLDPGSDARRRQMAPPAAQPKWAPRRRSGYDQDKEQERQLLRDILAAAEDQGVRQHALQAARDLFGC